MGEPPGRSEGCNELSVQEKLYWKREITVDGLGSYNLLYNNFDSSIFYSTVGFPKLTLP